MLHSVLILGSLAVAALATPEGKIVGSVVQLTGDHMPTTKPEGPKGTSRPLAVPVYVFRGKIPAGPELSPPRPDDPRIAAIVQSAADGTFEARLPAGTYTVFALIDKRLYSNAFDGKNHFLWVTLNPGRESHVLIKDTRHATF